MSSIVWLSSGKMNHKEATIFLAPKGWTQFVLSLENWLNNQIPFRPYNNANNKGNKIEVKRGKYYKVAIWSSKNKHFHTLPQPTKQGCLPQTKSNVALCFISLKFKFLLHFILTYVVPYERKIEVYSLIFQSFQQEA